MADWNYVTHGIDGNVNLFGVNIFDYEWKPTGKRVDVVDPLHKQVHRGFYVYNVNIGKDNFTFAAGEYSNCVWGFYIKQ